jgi:hypothetical protein
MLRQYWVFNRSPTQNNAWFTVQKSRASIVGKCSQFLFRCHCVEGQPAAYQAPIRRKPEMWRPKCRPHHSVPSPELHVWSVTSTFVTMLHIVILRFRDKFSDTFHVYSLSVSTFHCTPISVTVRSEVLNCDGSVAGNVLSNPAVDVCFLWVLCVVK